MEEGSRANGCSQQQNNATTARDWVMCRPIALLYALVVALLGVAATHAARSATWPVTALLQTWQDHHPLVVAVEDPMVASVQVMVLPTIELLHATSVADPITTLAIVKLKL